MFLSDQDIMRAIRSGRILIEPHPDYDVALGPCSLDLRLGNAFRETWAAKPFEAHSGQQTFRLSAGQCALATTLESIILADDIAAVITGRSTYGRQWVTVTGDSGLIPAGWQGEITLELRNHGFHDIPLPIGGRICQLMFVPLSSPAVHPYGSKPTHRYQNQAGPTPARTEKRTLAPVIVDACPDCRGTVKYHALSCPRGDGIEKRDG